jgi:hypothetical protein
MWVARDEIVAPTPIPGLRTSSCVELRPFGTRLGRAWVAAVAQGMRMVLSVAAVADAFRGAKATSRDDPLAL